MSEAVRNYAIAAGIVGVLGVGVWLFFKDPAEIPKALFKAGDGLGKGMEESLAPMRDGVKAATGGFVDMELRTLGRLSTTQASIESKIKKDNTTGANIGISLFSITGAGTVASVVNGVTKQTMLGKDKKLQQEIASHQNPARDEMLLKQTDVIAEAQEKGDLTVLDKIKIKNPTKYLSEDEIKSIENVSDRLLDHGVWIIPLKDYRNRFRKALIAFHEYKQCQLAGLFLSDIDKEAVQMNAEQFIHNLQKIVHPRALIIVDKKKTKAVEAFLKKNKI